jgi:Tetratricopeptide repeat
MFRHAILAILSVAALSAAAQAAAPCATHGKTGCHRPAVTAAAHRASPTRKARPAVHRNSHPAVRKAPDYAKAEALLTRALATRQSKLGEEHPLTLTTANSLAAVYKAQGRFREAEWLYHRSMEASEHAFGNGHPLTVAAIRSLASLYRAQGRFAEASLLCRRTGLADPGQYGY